MTSRAGGDIDDGVNIPLPDIPELDKNTLLSMERDAMGIYVSGHPLLEFADALKSAGPSCAALTAADGEGSYRDNQRVRTGGIITAVRTKPTKNGNGLMAYAILEDLSGAMELTVFPSVFQKYSRNLTVDSKVIVGGRLNMREDQNNTLLVDEVTPLTAGEERKLYLRMNISDERLMGRVSTILSRFPGNVPVVLYDEATKKQVLAPKNLFVNLSDAVMDVLHEILGEENVRLK